MDAYFLEGTNGEYLMVFRSMQRKDIEQLLECLDKIGGPNQKIIEQLQREFNVI